MSEPEPWESIGVEWEPDTRVVDGDGDAGYVEWSAVWEPTPADHFPRFERCTLVIYDHGGSAEVIEDERQMLKRERAQ